MPMTLAQSSYIQTALQDRVKCTITSNVSTIKPTGSQRQLEFTQVMASDQMQQARQVMANDKMQQVPSRSNKSWKVKWQQYLPGNAEMTWRNPVSMYSLSVYIYQVFLLVLWLFLSNHLGLGSPQYDLQTI